MQREKKEKRKKERTKKTVGPQRAIELQGLRFGAFSKWKQPLLCIAAAGALSAAVYFTQGQGALLEGTKLPREGYGGSEREYSLFVTGLSEDGGETELTITVDPQEYTEAEAEQAFSEAVEKLPELILGENESLSAVRSDLLLIRSIEGTGIRVTWYPEDTELISYEGEVKNGRLAEGRKTALRAVLSDGTHDSTYVIDVTVLPRLQSSEETAREALLSAIEKGNAAQITERVLTLPKEISGRALSYREKRGHEAAVLFFLGILAAVLLFLREGARQGEAQKRREEELRCDYSELVSKLIVYLGAGLTVKNAWLKIAGTYQKDRETESIAPRCVYEEMLETVRDMQKGIPEGRAYQAFGRRCRLQPYMKLCALLEQNRKNGSKHLRDLLEAEMSAAFEERKNVAKRRGEEAGTRLLIPLFLMLLIVMVIVILPAMMSMG